MGRRGPQGILRGVDRAEARVSGVSVSLWCMTVTAVAWVAVGVRSTGLRGTVVWESGISIADGYTLQIDRCVETFRQTHPLSPSFPLQSPLGRSTGLMRLRAIVSLWRGRVGQGLVKATCRKGLFGSVDRLARCSRE